jgi:signal transduction histidine kinase
MISPENKPTLYFLKKYDDKIVIGAISTDYIVSQGREIAFGQRGHAAIVDYTGQLMAHPLPAWRESMTNISRLAPVKKMLARETGTIMFFSPALKADMVAGYTYVPTTGWGVMIPQPFSELKEHAVLVRLWAIAISAVGVIAAGISSWFLAGYLTRPLSSVVGASQRMSHGDLDARADPDRGFWPVEIEELRTAFNTMAQDISDTMEERDQAQHERAQALALAEQANRAKSGFLADMSHELRSPLTAIIGFSDLMSHQTWGPLGDRRYETYVQDINQSGQHLLSIVNDILDISRIEAGEFPMDETEIDVAKTLSDCIAMTEIQARKSEISLEVDIPDHLPALLADGRHVKQIMINLLSNSVKFTLAGGQIKVSANLGNDSCMNIVVRDTGIGIPLSDISKVLLPFEQLGYPHLIPTSIDQNPCAQSLVPMDMIVHGS